MAAPQIPLAKQREIARLAKAGWSYRKIAAKLGVHDTVCVRYKNGPATSAPATAAEIEEAIRSALKREHMHAKDLAAAVGIGVEQLRRTIAEMRSAGAMIIELPGGAYDVAATAALEPGRHEIVGDPKAEWTHHFGLTSDNHLCNRHSRLDVLKAAYDYFEQQGITTVFNCGNWIDGEKEFNKAELLTAPGMDRQLDYLIDNWPVRKGITTLFIAGDDHEGWYQQREGVEVGKYLQLRAENQGRPDLKYLGYAECDVALRCGRHTDVMRLVHPGGGSAYATSYTAQKLVESYQGGEKPQTLLIGHYHKAEYGYPREVHCIQGGCTCDQTLFMRKKKIAAHVGFWWFKLKQFAGGNEALRCAHEFIPFYDRGFYKQQFR